MMHAENTDLKEVARIIEEETLIMKRSTPLTVSKMHYYIKGLATAKTISKLNLPFEELWGEGKIGQMLVKYTLEEIIEDEENTNSERRELIGSYYRGLERAFFIDLARMTMTAPSSLLRTNPYLPAVEMFNMVSDENPLTVYDDAYSIALKIPITGPHFFATKVLHDLVSKKYNPKADGIIVSIFFRFLYERSKKALKNNTLPKKEVVLNSIKTLEELIYKIGKDESLKAPDY